MLPVKDTFNIVVVGAWNPSIFNHTWIQSNLINNADTPLSVAFPLDDPTAPRKIGFDGLSLYPGRKQLLLSPDSLDSDGIKLCANKLIRILELLVHTPVGSCGVNFHFEESSNLVRVLGALNMNEQGDIDTDSYALASSNVTRKFQVQDQVGLEMNLSIMNTPNGITLGFNFHNESTDLNGVRELITEDYVEGLYNRAIVFCKDVYDLELEEGENNGQE